VPKAASHDMLLNLVDWVEKKDPPDTIVATRFADPTGTTVAMERPLCTYPKVPVFQGGNASKASSYLCTDAPRNGVPTPALKYLN
jgi:feruloyl esterase